MAKLQSNQTVSTKTTIPLQLPEEPAALAAILSRWGRAMEVRMGALEKRHTNLLEQVQALKP